MPEPATKPEHQPVVAAIVPVREHPRPTDLVIGGSMSMHGEHGLRS